ncbi:MAG TPA: ATP synthase F0 subunit C [bacterium]|nr:ATP synthase F0 subunit C [bacterium]
MKKTVVMLGVFMLATLVFAGTALAQEEGGLSSEVKSMIALSCGLGIAIAAFGGALGQGKAAAAAIEGIARNPGAYQKVFTPMILGLALIESLVIYSLLISFLLVFKL